MTPLKTGAEGRLRPLLLLALLAAAGLLVYSNTLHLGFHFDDQNRILDNEAIRSLDLARLWKFNPARFVSYLSFALNYQMAGYRPAGYHASNLLIHLLASFAVFGLTRKTLQAPAVRDSPAAGQGDRFAFFVALIFACHPVQTEAVTYVIQRTASLGALLYFAAVYFYAKSRLGGGAFFYALSLAAAALACFTKETCYTLPLALALYEACFLREPGRPLRLAPLLPFAAMLALALGLVFFAPLASHGLLSPRGLSLATRAEGAPLPRLEYVLTELNVVRTYLRLLFVPVAQNIDYDYPVSRSLFEPATAASAALLASLFMTGLFLFRRQRLAAFGIFWFFLTLSVESSVIPIKDVIFEHRLYLPLWGFSLAVCGMAASSMRPETFKKIFVAVTVLFAALAFCRNFAWRDEIALWSDAAEKSPRKARPLGNLAFALGSRGKHDRALDYAKRAVASDPAYAQAHFNLGLASMNLLRLDEGIAAFRRAAELEPGNAGYQYNLAHAFRLRGETDKAIEHYRNAAALRPAADIDLNLAGAYYEKKDYGMAVEYARQAVGRGPASSNAWQTLGRAHQKKGDFGNALEAFRRALALSPKQPEIHLDIANVHLKKGNLPEAEIFIASALRLDPALPRAYFLAGLLYFEKKDHGKVLETAEKLSQLGQEGMANLLRSKTIAAMKTEAGERARARAKRP